MSPPELAGDIALNLLAALQRHQREGTPMTDPIHAEARRHHAAVCRDHNPHVTDEQIDRYWEGLGEQARDSYLRTARRKVDAEVAR